MSKSVLGWLQIGAWILRSPTDIFSRDHARACNGDSIARAELARLVEQYKVHGVVETGTFKGYTTWFLASLSTMPIVHSIEADTKTFLAAKAKLWNARNIRLHLGNSGKVLGDLLDRLPKQTALFYLDAHWNSYWPLADELNAIVRFRGNRDIIVIDDFHVPAQAWNYDSYSGCANDLETLKSMLDIDRYHYYFPRESRRRIDGKQKKGVGQIYLIPKSVDDSCFFQTETGTPLSNLVANE